MKYCLIVVALLLCAGGFPSSSFAQGPQKGPDPSTLREMDAEKDANHNLDVARQYFKLKKAYNAAISRCEEIIAANPKFSHMDEVLFIAGESSLLLSQHKGKQSPKDPPDKLRKDARDYLSQLVKSYPDSAFKKQAESDLQNQLKE
jgi:outer membrane protein assembly factor BamD (BamD/ComL family)